MTEFGRSRDYTGVRRGGRGAFPEFVRKQEDATAASASIKDVAACAAGVHAQVRAVLRGVMAQRRSAGTAFGYVCALARGVRANCWDLTTKRQLAIGQLRRLHAAGLAAAWAAADEVYGRSSGFRQACWRTW